MAKAGQESGWIILRTSGTATLSLVTALTDAGFEAWAPVEVRERLAGRKRELVEQHIAILPGYVFARLSDLEALLVLSHTPALNYRKWDSDLGRMVVKGRPHFTVFHMHGKLRPLPDDSLVALRSLECSLQKAAVRRKEQAKQKGPIPSFSAGEIVRVDGGGFEGLRLTVAENNTGKTVKLIHPAWMWTVEISAWKLRSIQVSRDAREQGTALAA